VARSAILRALDSAAEATVVPSFTRVGIAFRSRLEHWDEPSFMHGRTVVVTGATSGIGLAVALGLARCGATLHLVGRSAERAARARSLVERAGSRPVQVDLVDMADPGEVEELASRLLERYDALGALVHCAGALTRSFQTTSSGTEITVATHVLGPYVLTAKVSNLLWRDPPATIVTVSSAGMYTQRFDLRVLQMGPDDYNGLLAYARAKRAQVVLADAWAGIFAPADVRSYAMHPGWVDTPGLAAGLPRFRSLWRPLLRTPAEGADTAVWLAGAPPGIPKSGFFFDRRLRSEARFPVTHPTGDADSDALVDWCAARTGVETPVP
jgi:dehydrogenase/reductase SDR family protein 12